MKYENNNIDYILDNLAGESELSCSIDFSNQVISKYKTEKNRKKRIITIVPIALFLLINGLSVYYMANSKQNKTEYNFENQTLSYIIQSYSLYDL